MPQNNLPSHNKKKSSGVDTLLWLVCIAYVISPIDFFPGLIDDAIMSFATFGLTRILS